MRRRLISFAVLSLGIVLVPVSQAIARDLTFEDRVKAQEAIERVYYSHQIGATKPFEVVVSRPVLEQKVRVYLKETVVLEKYWHTRITGDMLQKEMERMARQTRMPDRFREIYHALRDDSFLVGECLARPVLVDRLVRNFYAFDQEIHSEARQKAESIRKQLLSGLINPLQDHPNRTVVELIRIDPAQGRRNSQGDLRPLSTSHASLSPIELGPDEFDNLKARLPSRVGEIGTLMEESEVFVVAVTLDSRPEETRVASFAVKKRLWDDWWNQIEDSLSVDAIEAVAPEDGPRPDSPGGVQDTWGIRSASLAGDAQAAATSMCATEDTWDNGSLSPIPYQRTLHTAVWTGNVMVIWGGSGYGRFVSGPLSEGWRYDPAIDRWTPTSTTNAPTPRYDHAAVWTGSQMIVWGGYADFDPGTGGRYDPINDTWRPTSRINAPPGTRFVRAVWTGTQMIVWGGYDGHLQLPNVGGRYDPEADSWMPMSAANAPSGRYGHTAVWTGNQLVLWGGRNLSTDLADGGRYDPASNSWSPTTTIGAPSARSWHTAVSASGIMIVWGGVFDRSYPPLNTGGRYDPETDTWSRISTMNAPSGRYLHTAVWTGGRMLVWGGSFYESAGFNFNTGGGYDPASDSWTPISTMNAPEARDSHSAVWTGDLMVVWGGNGKAQSLNTGGRYDPANDSWTPTSATDAPSGRFNHTAIWTGNLMIIWGGQGLNPFAYFQTGGRYDPVTDTWTSTSTTNAPRARYGHTAVWTGTSMVIWAGTDNFFELFDSGGRYDPISDTWTSTSTSNAPTPRFQHTAVWTGNLMVIWGGIGIDGDNLFYFQTGGRYSPSTDTWTPTTEAGAPSRRSGHTATWTGSSMVVWGGADGSTYLNTGALYHPEGDSWSPIATKDAPEARHVHTAIWTNNLMVIWGGQGLALLNTGGRYDPRTDTWTPTSTINAPTPRYRHAAVWTGGLMVVWGGHSNLITGGRYDPVGDAWTPTSTENAPLAGVGYTAVWAGTSMVVWGGIDGVSSLKTGGRYCACAVKTYYKDSDGDGFGRSDVPLESCATPEGYVLTSGDCDDNDPTIHPGVTEVCNGRDDTCDGQIDEGFDVGSNCAVDVDECHQTIGRRQCRADGTGTQCIGDIVLHDTTPPLISCPSNITLECPATSGNIGYPIVTDACDPKPHVVSDAPAALPLGVRVVTWVATDASGNSSNCEQKIAVVDTRPPEIAVSLVPSFLWPPNHRMVPVQATWQVTDACDPAASVILASATSSELDDTPGNEDGNTTGDIQDASIGTPDTAVLLRAERSGDGPGRVYTLTYVARDASGNSASALGIVTVPHDEGTGPEPVMMSLEGDGTPGMAHLYWNAVTGAEMYDVIQGDLSQATVSSGTISLGPVHVLASGQTEASYSEGPTGAIPPVGTAFFYLVQYRDGQRVSGWGTESSPWPAEPTSCDIGCPGKPVAPSVASMTTSRK